MNCIMCMHAFLCMEWEMPQILIKNCFFFSSIYSIYGTMSDVLNKKKSEMKQRRDSCKINQSTRDVL